MIARSESTPNPILSLKGGGLCKETPSPLEGGGGGGGPQLRRLRHRALERLAVGVGEGGLAQAAQGRGVGAAQHGPVEDAGEILAAAAVGVAVALEEPRALGDLA